MKNNIKYLFANFLNDRVLYGRTENYWRKKISMWLNIKTIKPYFKTSFANGKPFMEGNPIFSTYIKRYQKIIRIIQHKPESEYPYIHAYIDSVIKEHQQILELVIILELSDKTLELAKSLIQNWITNNLSAEEMEQYIEKNIREQPILA